MDDVEKIFNPQPILLENYSKGIIIKISPQEWYYILKEDGNELISLYLTYINKIFSRIERSEIKKKRTRDIRWDL